MALVPCPECHKEVSTQALACPQCAFPFPGKHGLQEGELSASNACRDCGNPVSKQAGSCPHCGVKIKGDLDYEVVNGDANEETWLCSHCGTSHIGKNNRGEDTPIGHQEEPSLSQPDNGLNAPIIGKGQRTYHAKAEAFSAPRRRSPLWQDPSITIATTTKDIPPSRYPRRTQKSIIVGILVLVLVAMSVVMGALWQLKGLNPLEALIYWRM
ncbi:MAG: hypothetical protein V3T42_09350 [Nitrospirales bacterium]